MTQYQPPWDSVPLLALKCIFENMELKDVLAASSTCRHWRSTLLMYDGDRPCLKLHTSEDPKKHEMLARIFKKNLRMLHIYIAPNQPVLNQFTLHVLPQFLDSVNLQEVIFIGPIYMSLNKATPYFQLRRVIFETLVHKHARVLEKLAVFGCGINHLDEDDRYTSKHMALYSKPLSFHALEYLSPTKHENSILSRHNVNTMRYSNINHIVFEYELISTHTLITLSELDNLQTLSLNIIMKTGMCLPIVEWAEVTPLYRKGLQVAVNIIGLPSHRVQYVIDNVFSAAMPLTSLKVMFCRLFYMKLVHHITALYQKTLTEFSWVDRPSRGDKQKRLIKFFHESNDVNASYNFVNPFIYLAWQCKQLRKLTIHGYWICEYDLIGITRLREDMDIDVSAIYDSRADLPTHRGLGGMYRVMESPLHDEYRVGAAQRTNTTVKVRSWADLPAGLKSRSTLEERTEYIVSEVMHPLGVT